MLLKAGPRMLLMAVRKLCFTTVNLKAGPYHSSSPEEAKSLRNYRISMMFLATIFLWLLAVTVLLFQTSSTVGTESCFGVLSPWISVITYQLLVHGLSTTSLFQTCPTTKQERQSKEKLLLIAGTSVLYENNLLRR